VTPQSPINLDDLHTDLKSAAQIQKARLKPSILDSKSAESERKFEEAGNIIPNVL